MAAAYRGDTAALKGAGDMTDDEMLAETEPLTLEQLGELRRAAFWAASDDKVTEYMQSPSWWLRCGVAVREGLDRDQIRRLQCDHHPLVRVGAALRIDLDEDLLDFVLGDRCWIPRAIALRVNRDRLPPPDRAIAGRDYRALADRDARAVSSALDEEPEPVTCQAIDWCEQVFDSPVPKAPPDLGVDSRGDDRDRDLGVGF